MEVSGRFGGTEPHRVSRRPVGLTAGVTDGTPVRVVVKPGRIVIEAETEPTLEQMLAAFDPKKHGGESMAGGSVGVEAFVR